MDFLMVIIILLLFAISKISNKDEERIYRLILIWYAVVYCFSSFNLYDLYNVSNYTIVLLTISIVMLSIGFMPKYIVHVKKTDITYTESVYSSKIFHTLSAFAGIILIIFLQRFLSIPSYDYYALRMSRFQTGIVFRSLTEIMFYNYVISPFVIIQMCVLIYGLWTKKIKIPLVFLCGIDILCYLIIGYGRIVFLQILFIFIVVAICEKKERNIKKSNRKIGGKKILLIIAAMAAAGFSMLYVTVKRLGVAHITLDIMLETVETTVKQSYVYICGAQRALDYAIVNYNDLLGRHFFRMTFSGIDEVIVNVLLFLGISISSINSTYGIITQKSIMIGKNVDTNALYTGIFNFYFDAGIIGILIYSVLLGVAFKYFLTRYYKRRSIPNLVILCNVAFGVFAMPIKWVFSSGDMMLLIIICLIWDNILMRKGR